MLLTTAIRSRDACLNTIDPRVRIITAVVWSVVAVTASRLGVIALALAGSTVAAMLSGLPWGVVVKRLLPLNAVMLLLALWLPLITSGTPIWEGSGLSFSREGARLALDIALKGNAVLLTLIALVGTMDASVLGHALRHLHVPDKLAHLLLFTVRYLDVLHREYSRLRTAMKARGFRCRMDLHTYRSLGYLVGMLLVRSFDRAERIAAAMKCRGFQGRFFLLDHFAFARRDAAFCGASAAMLLLLLLFEWRVL